MTKYMLTKAQLVAMDPCGLDERLRLFGSADQLTLAEALEAGASVSDILWVAGAMGFGAQCAEFAIRCAESVVKHSSDERVQAAIDAAKAYVADPTQENRRAADDAALTADDAAYAARDAAYAATQQKKWLLEIFKD